MQKACNITVNALLVASTLAGSIAWIGKNVNQLILT